MAYLYILRNIKNKHYIGITALDPRRRLLKHNKGDVFSTKTGRPWTLIHVEEFKNLNDARFREKIIKSWHGGNAFKKLVAKAAGSSNGRTHGSGPWYLGSSPSPAALVGRNKSGGVKSRRTAG